MLQDGGKLDPFHYIFMNIYQIEIGKHRETSRRSLENDPN